MITLTIDGREVHAEPGMVIYQAAKAAGIEIPIFCYHPHMKPVAACRMCLVKVEKMPKLQTACSTPVAEGMVVWTQVDEVKKAQEGVLEFLLAQHPLDCPICDKGGECPLQDQSFRWGPGHTRFSEAKRHLDKARSLGPLVVLDQERCIQCQRCTRFCEEIVGDPVLALQNRGAYTVVDVAPGRTFDSIYSGNTIEMCPVGALTSRPYRFRARPWDIVPLGSICPHCPVGCNITVTVRDVDVMRILSRENEEVDQGWLCDRGRFGYGFLTDEGRLKTPLVRDGDTLREATWDEAVARVAAGVAGRKVAALGGARLSTEALFAWKEYLDRLSADYDWRVAGEATAIGPGAPARIVDVDDADGFLFVDAAPLEEVPVLHLRIRQQVVNRRGARVVVVGARTGVTDLPHRSVLVPPGGAAEAIKAALAGGEGPLAELLHASHKLVVLWDGRDPAVFDALSALAAQRGDRFTGVFVTGAPVNGRGAQLVGFQPSEGHGRATGEILAALRDGEIGALFVLAEDVVRRHPDGALVEAALSSSAFKVVVDHFRTATADSADVVLPLAAFTEAAGSFVNLEGRRQPFEPVVAAPEGVEADYAVPARITGDTPPESRDLARLLLAKVPALAEPPTVPQGFLPPGGTFRPGPVQVVPSLYRRGVTPERHLPHLAEAARHVTVHPDLAARLGLTAGDEVAVGDGSGGSAVVVVDANVWPETLFLDDGVPGANVLSRPEDLKVLARRDA